MLKNIIKLSEPQRWIDLLKHRNYIVNANESLKHYIPLTADVFVLVYPIYLIIMYLTWIYKKDIEYKVWAIYILFSGLLTVVINLWIQFLVDKQRPEQIALSKDNLIFQHVPSKPFPSDHAAVSATIAMATLIWGIKHKNKGYIIWGCCLWVFSIVMSLSRIAAGVHWPTDIIAGTLVGIFAASIIIQDKFFVFLKSKLIYPLIRIEKLIFKMLGIKQ